MSFFFGLWLNLTTLEPLTFTGTVFTHLDVLLHGFTELGGEIVFKELGKELPDIGATLWDLIGAPVDCGAKLSASAMESTLYSWN